jgi:hypothetical protein
VGREILEIALVKIPSYKNKPALIGAGALPMASLIAEYIAAFTPLVISII